MTIIDFLIDPEAETLTPIRVPETVTEVKTTLTEEEYKQ